MINTELQKNQYRQISKVELMDNYFLLNGHQINSSEICKIVSSVFGFNLDETPILLNEDELNQFATNSEDGSRSKSRLLIDSFLSQQNHSVTTAEIRVMINQLFGINLDAISALEHSKISIFSKNQWVVRSEKDLFIVHTGTGDNDVKILPTSFFSEQTGLSELPRELQFVLSSIGFSFNEEIGAFYYSCPTGNAVSDAFKGQTIGAIRKVIQQAYNHL